jgi:hypothetical protein
MRLGSHELIDEFIRRGCHTSSGARNVLRLLVGETGLRFSSMRFFDPLQLSTGPQAGQASGGMVFRWAAVRLVPSHGPRLTGLPRGDLPLAEGFRSVYRILIATVGLAEACVWDLDLCRRVEMPTSSSWATKGP